ncbi:MAG: TylF/MycF/NovP-related O-methyltransferase [Caulobacterales bacterium]
MPKNRPLKRLQRSIVDPFQKPMRWLEVEDRRLFFRRAIWYLKFNGISGDYVEFGFGSGGTFTTVFKECERQRAPLIQWGFDSFEGLPAPDGKADDHPNWHEGAFGVGLERARGVIQKAKIPENRYRLVKGFYSDSLKQSSDARPSNIALAYVDCDMYSSTKDVLAFLLPRLKNSMIVAFDDYFCPSEASVSGERKALREFERENPQFTFLPYMQFGWAGMSFIVEDSAQL